MDLAKILLKQQLKEENTVMTIRPSNGSTPEQYLKWISYVPVHWQVQEILNKNALDLKSDELEILKILKKENEVKPYFENIVSSEPTKSESAYYAYLYMKSISIYEYAQLKLTKEQLAYCHEYVSLVEKEFLKEEIKNLLSPKNNSVIEDYILFLLKKKQSSIIFKKSENEIQSQIEANRAMHNRGIEYAAQPYLKKKR